MIVGTGLDLIEIDRIARLVHNEKFVSRILTASEKAVFDGLAKDRRRAEFLAGRFAAKEAYAKARGTGIGAGLSWQDIEILSDAAGRPRLKERHPTQDIVHLTITHAKDYAAAVVVIESLSGSGA